jgi:hypothetical protein
MTGQHRQQLTPDVPVIDPREARKGRFLVSRRRYAEVVAYAQQLEDSLRKRHVSLRGWEVVATFTTSTHEWQLFAREAGK